MHKPFYASGFLYHPASQQILLYQPPLLKNPLAVWKTFGGLSCAGEDAPVTFRRIIYEQTKIRLKVKCLFPVYDYFSRARNVLHYVFYAEVEKLFTFPLLKTGVLSWFTFKSTNKLSFADCIKQDMIVSERVINAQARSKKTSLLQPEALPSSTLS